MPTLFFIESEIYPIVSEQPPPPPFSPIVSQQAGGAPTVSFSQPETVRISQWSGTPPAEGVPVDSPRSIITTCPHCHQV